MCWLESAAAFATRSASLVLCSASVKTREDCPCSRELSYSVLTDLYQSDFDFSVIAKEEFASEAQDWL